MKYICDSCEKYPCSADETKLMLLCPAYSPKPKPITNADRIRSMSDDELAEFMCHNVSNNTVNCAFCAAEEFCRFGHIGWLDWLKREVK